ncbi:MAG: CHAT domain-containing tetratricopeptide repeat protein [Planctomycetota bacterium]|nr:CHAT domain-containing tetratricopeptide repeat protein [Planctomycetota bacterium]
MRQFLKGIRWLFVVAMLLVPCAGVLHGAEPAPAATPPHVHEVVKAEGPAAVERVLRGLHEHELWTLAQDLVAFGRKDLIPLVANAIRPDHHAAFDRALATDEDPALVKTLWRALDSIEKEEWAEAEKILRTLPGKGARLLVARRHLAAGDLHFGQHAYEVAAAEYLRATRVCPNIDWRAGERFAWLCRQGAYDALCDMVALRRGYEELVRLHELDRNPLLADMHRINLAGVLVKVGEPAAGHALFDEVIGRLSTSEGHTYHLAYAQTSQAMCLASNGCLARAMSLASQTAAAFRAMGAPEDEAYALAVLSAVRGDLGGEANHERVLKLCERIEAIPMQDPRYRADALFNRGLSSSRLGLYDDARQAFLDAIHVYKTQKDPVSQAKGWINLGDAVYESQGRHKDAMGAYARARALAISAPDTQAWIDVMEGRVHAARGEWTKALASLDAASKRAAPYHLPALQLRAAVPRARALLALEQTAQAQASIDQAYAFLAELTHGLGDETQAAARGARTKLYELGVRVARAGGRSDLLVAALERARASALLECLGGLERLHAVALPSDLQVALGQAKAEVVRLRQAELLAHRRGTATRPAGKARLAAERKLSAISDRVRSEAKLLADLTLPEPAELDALHAALGKTQALVWYTYVDDDVLATVLTAKDLKTIRLGGTAAVERLVEQLDLRDALADCSEAASVCEGLRNVVVDKIALPDSVTRVLISPTRSLTHLPWPYLWGKRKNVRVALVPSATTWQLIRTQRARTGKGLLALGDPVYVRDGEPLIVRGREMPRLEHSGKEVRAIAGKQGKPLVREQATKAELLAALAQDGRRESIHLACHGVLDSASSALSALLLTRTNHDDGFLRALDVVGLRVDADLVVLSACSVARDKVAQGEGLMGLTRAFMAAGAPRVIASLQTVDDEATTELMKAFYREWRKPGVSTAEALHRAQQHVASQPQWKHPWFWANWVLWGLPD